MSEVASRLYKSAAAAEEAASALRRAGYQPTELTVISPAKGGDGARDAVVAAARQAGVFKGRAAQLADGVMKGATAVVCRARFAQATMVHGILDARGPLDAGDTSGRASSSEAEAAPLSGMLGLPVLGGRGDLLSRMFGLPTLSSQQRGTSTLIGQTGPYKPVVPMATLSNADGKGGYKPSVPLPLLSGAKGGYKPVIPMPTLSKGDRGGYRPIIPLPLLTSKRA